MPTRFLLSYQLVIHLLICTTEWLAVCKSVGRCLAQKRRANKSSAKLVHYTQNPSALATALHRFFCPGISKSFSVLLPVAPKPPILRVSSLLRLLQLPREWNRACEKASVSTADALLPLCPHHRWGGKAICDRKD